MIVNRATRDFLKRIMQDEFEKIEWALDTQIRETAYYKWEQAGMPNDISEHFWLEAESEVCAYFLNQHLEESYEFVNRHLNESTLHSPPQ